MREITQVEKFHVRGKMAIEKITSIIKSKKAREILIEDERGDLMFRISPDIDFLTPTLDMVRGMLSVIKNCSLVVIKKQALLFR